MLSIIHNSSFNRKTLLIEVRKHARSKCVLSALTPCGLLHNLRQVRIMTLDYFALIASVRIRPIELLGVSRLNNEASVGAMSAGLLIEGNFPAVMPAP